MFLSVFACVRIWWFFWEEMVSKDGENGENIECELSRSSFFYINEEKYSFNTYINSIKAMFVV